MLSGASRPGETYICAAASFAPEIAGQRLGKEGETWPPSQNGEEDEEEERNHPKSLSI